MERGELSRGPELVPPLCKFRNGVRFTVLLVGTDAMVAIYNTEAKARARSMREKGIVRHRRDVLNVRCCWCCCLFARASDVRRCATDRLASTTSTSVALSDGLGQLSWAKVFKLFPLLCVARIGAAAKLKEASVPVRSRTSRSDARSQGAGASVGASGV